MCFYKNPTITPHLTVGKCPRPAFSKDGARACRSRATALQKHRGQCLFASLHIKEDDCQFFSSICGPQIWSKRQLDVRGIGCVFSWMYFIRLLKSLFKFMIAFHKDFEWKKFINYIVCRVLQEQQGIPIFLYYTRCSRSQRSNNARERIKLFTRIFIGTFTSRQQWAKGYH